MIRPGWDRWCEKEFLYKMQQEGKVEPPTFAGQTAKTRRHMDMNETRDRIFPDELDTRIDIGNFETSSSARKASRQEKRDRRKVLEQKCKSLEDELREETVRTQAIQQQLSTKRTPTVTPPSRAPTPPHTLTPGWRRH